MSRDLKGRYCFSTDGHTYEGDFATEEEVIEEMIAIGVVEATIGRFSDRYLMETDGSDLVEWLTDDTSDRLGLEDALFGVYCKGSETDLAKELQAVLDKFFDQHPIQWFKVDPIRRWLNDAQGR